MTDFTDYVLDNDANFKVATAAYGQGTFDQEMDSIFRETWIYLCHESEISKPGDFKATWLGREPVVVVRDKDGSVKAFRNFCPHRGSVLCREEYGNSKTLVCPYHAWTFELNGRLRAPADRSRYPDSFSNEEHSLAPVPMLASYGGLVFGSFNKAVPSLDEHLGDAKKHIDLWLGRCAGGTYRVSSAYKYAYDGNWKLQVENVIDGYHVSFVHRSAFGAIAKFSGSFEGRVLTGVRDIGFTRGYPGGHSTLEAGTPLESGGWDPDARQRYNQKLVELYGADTAKEIVNGRHLVIFPNVILMDFNIRVVQPISWDRTEVYAYPLLIDGVEDAVNVTRLADVQTRLGTAGIVSADDIDVFNGAQTALSAAGPDWIVLSRGLGQEQQTESGERIGAFSDEVPQRAFWRRWREMMSSEARMEVAAE